MTRVQGKQTAVELNGSRTKEQTRHCRINEVPNTLSTSLPLPPECVNHGIKNGTRLNGVHFQRLKGTRPSLVYSSSISRFRGDWDVWGCP